MNPGVLVLTRAIQRQLLPSPLKNAPGMSRREWDVWYGSIDVAIATSHSQFSALRSFAPSYFLFVGIGDVQTSSPEVRSG
jgi:hypothetical protein